VKHAARAVQRARIAPSCQRLPTGGHRAHQMNKPADAHALMHAIKEKQEDR
jgi:hypothetical protein